MTASRIPYETLLRKVAGVAPSLVLKAIPKIMQRQNPAWLQEYTAASKLALDQAGMYSPGLLKKVSLLPPQFFAEVFFLTHAPASAIDALRFRFVGLTKKQITAEVESGRGILLGCSNFGCFYKSLLACNGVIDEIVIILGEKPSRSTGLKERIERQSGMRIRLMTIESSCSIAVARQLGRGGVVATMLDTYLNNSPKFVSNFLGKPAATPSNIYRLAERSRARLLPLFNYRRDDGTDIEVAEPIDVAELGAERAAAAMGAVIEDRIRREPSQWMMWPSLLRKWSAAI